ncbi:hypothetical protein QQF64_033882 [Cirrhinus molitorella]|uniref:Uncharacterized protein n=1 Tax=Cirrhinus molitorella TaxID=172907 RepID=A0ABR3MV42_9TELE
MYGREAVFPSEVPIDMPDTAVLTLTPAHLPPGSSPAPLPPGSSPPYLPPGSSPAHLPPGSSPAHLPPGSSPAHLPPSSYPPYLPPSSSPAHLPSGSSPPYLPPGSSPAHLPPRSSPPYLPPGSSPPYLQPGPTPAIHGVNLHSDEMPSTSGSIVGQLFSPSLIRPFPKAGPRKETGRGRKQRLSEILTDTPVKLALEEEEHRKGKNIRKKILGSEKSKKRMAGKQYNLLHPERKEWTLNREIPRLKSGNF